MIDKAAEILHQYRRVAASPPKPNVTVEEFDERGYLWRYPDVAEGITRGVFSSAFEHYVEYGLREGRAPALIGEDLGLPFALHRDKNWATSQTPRHVRHDCDRLLISEGGGVLLIGWADDLAAPVHHVQIAGEGWTISIDGPHLVRSRRADVEQALSATMSHQFGYTGVLFVENTIPRCASCRIIVTLRSGASTEITTKADYVRDIELRDTILTHLSSMTFSGNPHVELIAQFGRGAGREIVKLNRSVTRQIVSNPFIQRFGRSDRRKKGSLVVCLYGKAEFVFLQNALFSRREGIEDYEFVYVSNSPELAETLVRDVSMCAEIYGVDQTLVLLPGNAGFGAANNVAARAIRSDRMIAINPDVFPRDPAWARKHAELVESADPMTVKLFGAPLYYDDGSLMHGGMFFDFDVGVAVRAGGIERQEMIRVEHYGKGAPEWAEDFARPRPVPAVTGAFISADRAWFEKLGGFGEDYVFGHYEDADLCLKSFVGGAPAWLQDLRLWHLEGKGSTRKAVHEGGSAVNRWLFMSQWAKTIADGLIGPEPQHPAFAKSSAPRSSARATGGRQTATRG